MTGRRVVLAVALDTFTSGGGQNGSTQTFAFNNAAGTFLLLGAAVWGGPVVSSATYNGVSLASAVAGVANNGDVEVEWWKLAAPATGNHNIVCTLSGSNDFLLLAWSFTGVHAVTPLGTCVGDGYTTNVANHAHDTTCATDGLVVDLFGANSAIGTVTANGGQDELLASTDQGQLRVISTSKAGATTVSMGYTYGASFARWAHATVPLMPAASGRGLFRTPSLGGIGVGGSYFRDPLQGARV